MNSAHIPTTTYISACGGGTVCTSTTLTLSTGTGVTAGVGVAMTVASTPLNIGAGTFIDGTKGVRFDGVMAYDDWKGIDWTGQMDGCMTKAPLGEKDGQNPPTGPRGHERSLLVEAEGIPVEGERPDMKMVEETLEISRTARGRRKKGLCWTWATPMTRCKRLPGVPFTTSRRRSR